MKINEENVQLLETFFWPFVKNTVEKLVKSYDYCNIFY